MHPTLKEIRGLHAPMAEKLAQVDVVDLDDLVALARDDERRRSVAAWTGLHPAQLRRFVGMAEILSLEEMAREPANALFDAGIDSFEKLRAEPRERLRGVLVPVDARADDHIRAWTARGPSPGTRAANGRHAPGRARRRA